MLRGVRRAAVARSTCEQGALEAHIRCVEGAPTLEVRAALPSTRSSLGLLHLGSATRTHFTVCLETKIPEPS